MSRLLLCISPIAKYPYYLEEDGVHIYSAEELCYYIGKNAFLIEDGFFTDSLLGFLEKDLNLPALAQRLKKSREKDSLEQQLYLFLKEVGYHSEDELEQFEREMEKKRQAKPWELTKKKGDYFVSQKKYEAALRAYDSILDEREKNNLPAEFVAEVYHNKGVALIRCFFFSDGAECLEKSYDLSPDEEVLKKLFGLKLLDPGTGILPERFASVPAQVQYKWKEEFERLKNQAYFEGKAAETETAFLRDSVKRPLAVEELLKTWKKECKEMA